MMNRPRTKFEVGRDLLCAELDLLLDVGPDVLDWLTARVTMQQLANIAYTVEKTFSKSPDDLLFDHARSWRRAVEATLSQGDRHPAVVAEALVKNTTRAMSARSSRALVSVSEVEATRPAVYLEDAASFERARAVGTFEGANRELGYLWVPHDLLTWVHVGVCTLPANPLSGRGDR